MPVFIFDLDGTLVDSKRDIVFSVNRAFLRLGFPALPEEEVAREIGRGSAFLFRRLLGATVPDGRIEALVVAFKEVYGRHLLDRTRTYPGIVELLSRFGAFRKAVVTNKNQVFADRIVDGLGLRGHFQGVYGSEAFATQKPDPGPILGVCRKWGVAPSEAVVIGDSPFDVAAGKAAGARTVAVRYGFGGPEAFRADPPDFAVDSVDALVGLFPFESLSGRS